VNVRGYREEDRKSGRIHIRVVKPVKVEERAPDAHRTGQIQIGDRQTINLTEVEERNRVLVILAAHNHVRDDKRSDVLRIWTNRVCIGFAVHEANNFNGIVRKPRGVRMETTAAREA